MGRRGAAPIPQARAARANGEGTGYFFSVILTDARVRSQSTCMVQTLPLGTKEIVRSSSGDARWETVMGRRAKSNCSPG